MRNVYRGIGLLTVCAALVYAGCASAKAPVRKDEAQQQTQQTQQILKQLEAIKEVVVAIEEAQIAQNKAPRYDAPGYGAPGSAVPSPLAIDLASLTQQFCCCVQCLLAELPSVTAIDGLMSVLDGISTEVERIESKIGEPDDVIDCSVIDELNLCDDINAQTYSVVKWLKAIFYVMNHIPTP